jgi:hypothetical protein
MNFGKQTRHKIRVGEAPCLWIKQYQCCIFRNNPIWPVRWGALIERHKTSISWHPILPLDPPPPPPRTIDLLLCQRKQYGVKTAVTVWLRKESGSIILHPIHISLRPFPINKPLTHTRYSVRCNMEKKLRVVLYRWRLGLEISVVIAINYLCVRKFECSLYTQTRENVLLRQLCT